SRHRENTLPANFSRAVKGFLGRISSERLSREIRSVNTIIKKLENFNEDDKIIYIKELKSEDRQFAKATDKLLSENQNKSVQKKEGLELQPEDRNEAIAKEALKLYLNRRDINGNYRYSECFREFFNFLDGLNAEEATNAILACKNDESAIFELR